MFNQHPSDKPQAMSRRSLIQRTATVTAVAVPLGILAVYGSNSNALMPNTTTFGPLKVVGDNKTAFTEIQADENAHVKFLVGALGANARPKPTFKAIEQADVMAFAKVSQALENTGVGAYLLAAPFVSSKDYLAAAGSILTIEARHAGFIDVLLGTPLSPNGAFDKPLAQADIVAAASPFIASLNGGGDPSATLANDLDILNFALLLEYLEAEFYNINVPKFFK